MALLWLDPPTEEATVVPLGQFYPPDLPELDMTDGGFNWTDPELQDAAQRAREWLFHDAIAA